MNADEWFIADAESGATSGPMIGDELVQRMLGGQVKPDDLVWCEGMTQWQKAALFAWLLEP